jgi:hypothetical protein
VAREFIDALVCVKGHTKTPAQAFERGGRPRTPEIKAWEEYR